MTNVLELEPLVKEGEIAYHIKSLADIVEAVEQNVRTFPHHSKVRILLSMGIDKDAKRMIVEAITNRLGYEWSTIGNAEKFNEGVWIRYRGYTRWVYFKNTLPVWFDMAGSGTDTPSHRCGWRNKIYDVLEFDEVRKIYIDGSSTLGKRGVELGNKTGIT